MGVLWGFGVFNEKKSIDNNFIFYFLDGGIVIILIFFNILYIRVLNFIYSR